MCPYMTYLPDDIPLIIVSGLEMSLISGDKRAPRLNADSLFFVCYLLAKGRSVWLKTVTRELLKLCFAVTFHFTFSFDLFLLLFFNSI